MGHACTAGRHCFVVLQDMGQGCGLPGAVGQGSAGRAVGMVWRGQREGAGRPGACGACACPPTPARHQWSAINQGVASNSADLDLLRLLRLVEAKFNQRHSLPQRSSIIQQQLALAAFLKSPGSPPAPPPCMPNTAFGRSSSINRHTWISSGSTTLCTLGARGSVVTSNAAQQAGVGRRHMSAECAAQNSGRWEAAAGRWRWLHCALPMPRYAEPPVHCCQEVDSPDAAAARPARALDAAGASKQPQERARGRGITAASSTGNRGRQHAPYTRPEPRAGATR